MYPSSLYSYKSVYCKFTILDENTWCWDRIGLYRVSRLLVQTGVSFRSHLAQIILFGGILHLIFIVWAILIRIVQTCRIDPHFSLQWDTYNSQKQKKNSCFRNNVNIKTTPTEHFSEFRQNLGHLGCLNMK